MFYDERDTASNEAREAALFTDFKARLSAIADRLPGFAAHVGKLDDVPDVVTRAELAHLPVLRKHTLMAMQQADPPFGGFVDEERLAGQRLFMSPGPVFEPQLPQPDPWQGARALHAAGVRAGERVHNAFSYHLTPGGFILDESARALGCVVFPAGVGNTATQVAALRQSRASVYVGTPDYLQVLLDHAREEGQPIDTLRRALVSGGALFPSMRATYRDAGIAVLQCYATADLGVIAYETVAADGDPVQGMLVNEDIIVEIVVPGSGAPVSPGEVGEVLVTRLDPVYPLLRFATGDLSAFLDTRSPCGRTAPRIKGWLGRADERTKVRGMFVDPEQLQSLKDAQPAIGKLRLIVAREGNRDVMTLQVVPRATDQLPDTDILATLLKETVNLAGTVEIVDRLPDDGRVIEDRRDLNA